MPTTCSYDTGSMYGNAPACSAPATHEVRYRNGSYPAFSISVCARHVSPTEGRAFPGHLSTTPLPATASAADRNA